MLDRGDTASSKIADDRSATAEQLARLKAAFLTLPRFTREIFLAHRIDDLSYVEIADRTGVSVRRVEREIARVEKPGAERRERERKAAEDEARRVLEEERRKAEEAEAARLKAIREAKLQSSWLRPNQGEVRSTRLAGRSSWLSI